MPIDTLVRPKSLLLALCLGAAAGACTINVDPDDDGADDGDACHEECDEVHVDCAGNCDDADDECAAACDADFDECAKDC